MLAIICRIVGLKAGLDGSRRPLEFIWTKFQAKPSILDPLGTKFDVFGSDRNFGQPEFGLGQAPLLLGNPTPYVRLHKEQGLGFGTCRQQLTIVDTQATCVLQINSNRITVVSRVFATNVARPKATPS